MIEGIIALGYEGRFETVTMFKRKHLSRRWASLYMILNRCLSPSHSGMDTITSFMLKIFYGVAYHKHFDYARIIWDQLITVCKKKAKYDKYIPFVRFLSIMLDHFLKTKLEIPALDDEPQFTQSPMKYLQNSVGSEIATPAPIPNYLLALADRHDPAIKKYRELVLAMVPDQPQARIPRKLKEPGEGSIMSGSKQKNNEGKTNEGDLGAQAATNRRQTRRHVLLSASQPQLLIEPNDTSNPETLTHITQTSKSTPLVGGRQKKKTHKRKRVLEFVEEALPELLEQPINEPTPASDPPVVSPTLETESQQQTGTGNDDADRPFNNDVYDDDTVETESALERQVRNEDGVENSQFRPSPIHATNPTHPYSHSQPRTQIPFTQSVPPNVSACLDSQQVSFQSLRAFFHTRLLVEPNLSPYDLSILSILNLSSTATSQAQSDSAMIASRLDQIVNHLQNIDSRLAARESCRPFPTPYHRHQDHPDSQDPPEGES